MWQDQRMLRERRVRVPWSTPVSLAIESMFASRPPQEKELVKSVLVSHGIEKLSDLAKQAWHTGQLLDWGVPEWYCKALLSRGLVQHGLSVEQRAIAMECLTQELEPATVKEDAPTLTGEIDIAIQRRIHRSITRWPSWCCMAMGNFDDPEEEALLKGLFEHRELVLPYGFRALLRIVIREAPALYRMISSQCFVGTFYFLSHGGNSENDDVDWSSVVWMLQVENEEEGYTGSLVRLIAAVRKIFQSQPGRRLAFGLLAGNGFVEIHAFKKPAGCDEVLFPTYKKRSFFTYNRCHSGLKLIVNLMCAPPTVHGFTESRGGLLAPAMGTEA